MKTRVKLEPLILQRSNELLMSDALNLLLHIGESSTVRLGPSLCFLIVNIFFSTDNMPNIKTTPRTQPCVNTQSARVSRGKLKRAASESSAGSGSSKKSRKEKENIGKLYTFTVYFVHYLFLCLCR